MPQVSELKGGFLSEPQGHCGCCFSDPGTFDGAQLLWDVPQVVTPLVEDGAAFESRSYGLGVESVLLDEPTAASRGLTMDQQGGWVQIKVPFGAEGGYRKVVSSRLQMESLNDSDLRNSC